MNGIAAEGVAQLLAHTKLAELARRLHVDEARVHQWRRDGVPPGVFAAVLRYWARDNGISVQAPVSNQQCLLCSAPSSLLFAGVPVCDFCHSDPFAASEALGFRFASGHHHEALRVWIGVETPQAFEYPAAASMLPQERLWFTKPDLEIGHPDFDDAVRIETEDYEALFDLLQHPRRRTLAKVLATQLRLEINVDSVFAIFSANQDVYRDRIMLGLVLLAWSLTYDRSDPMVDE